MYRPLPHPVHRGGKRCVGDRDIPPPDQTFLFHQKPGHLLDGRSFEGQHQRPAAKIPEISHRCVRDQKGQPRHGGADHPHRHSLPEKSHPHGQPGRKDLHIPPQEQGMGRGMVVEPFQHKPRHFPCRQHDRHGRRRRRGGDPRRPLGRHPCAKRPQQPQEYQANDPPLHQVRSSISRQISFMVWRTIRRRSA